MPKIGNKRAVVLGHSAEWLPLTFEVLQFESNRWQFLFIAVEMTKMDKSDWQDPYCK